MVSNFANADAYGFATREARCRFTDSLQFAKTARFRKRGSLLGESHPQLPLCLGRLIARRPR